MPSNPQNLLKGKGNDQLWLSVIQYSPISSYFVFIHLIHSVLCDSLYPGEVSQSSGWLPYTHSPLNILEFAKDEVQKLELHRVPAPMVDLFRPLSGVWSGVGQV